MKELSFDASGAMWRFVLKPFFKKVLEHMLADYRKRCRSVRCCGDDGYVQAVALFDEALKEIKQ